MSFLVLKALHIIFVVTWFAGLFYIVRLFIYDMEARENPDLSIQEKDLLLNQFALMEKRLWYGITWPSAILTLLFGTSLLHHFFPLTAHPWLLGKLGLVVLLYLYHFSCGKIYRNLRANRSKLSSTQLRVWNEVATLFLVGIVFLVELKSFMSFGLAMLGLILFAALLMAGIKVYKKVRHNREKSS